MQKKSVIVVGAGIGGLATAALLAKDGYKVTVIEKNDQPGGRASQLKKKGFTFDMGPSWYLMPDVFEKFFQEFGYSANDLLQLVRFRPQYRIFYEDGTHVDITGEWKKDAALFESIEPGSSLKLREYLKQSKEKYDLSVNHFLYRNMDTVADFVRPEMMTLGPKLGVFESMDRYVSRFFKNRKLQQIIQYTLVFLGGAPSNTPALYSLMSHVDFNLGVWYPQGGMYEIVKALVKIGKEYGVTYVFNSPVTSLELATESTSIFGNKYRINNVRCGKKTYSADFVISNADYAFTEELLSEPKAMEYGPAYWQKRTLAPSAFLLYLGIKGKIPKLIHHNLYFGDDWVKHFDEIFKKPSWPKEPSLYINKTSYIDPQVAPKGHETLFILVPIASKLDETPASKEEYAEYILNYIEKKIGVKIKAKVVFKEIFSVSDFTSRYNSYGGTALGFAHTLFQTAIWRPRNQSQKVKNLLFVGGNTVPGIGVPICLISAELIRSRLAALPQ